ncbi:disease resistance protein (TIR-NBS-LRR class) [Artemisia annua]|uniref:Disease resistance protein (TIR-NBS-LRR class) n=1 Tax=Artemisia annua TaxID=35608 RepID=A0A2U1NDJ0_ARTAN|nr:disease resistance protein (TIR-NBS-LRR class) [Artemisia annua]
MVATLTKVVITIAVVVVLKLGWKLLNWAWLMPKKQEKMLREQGYKGNSYKPITGDIMELAKLTKEARSKPMSIISHDISQHVFTYEHHIFNKYGKKVYIWFGPKPRVFVRDPELIKDILSRPGEFQRPQHEPLRDSIIGGLAASEGEKWTKHRHIINPAFHLENVISRAAFSSSYEEGQKIFRIQKEQMELMIQLLFIFQLPGGRFIPTRANKKFQENRNKLQALARGIVDKRRKAIEMGEPHTYDLLGILLESNSKETKENGNGMSIEDVIEECKLFYIAGSETTSTLILWTMVCLSLHQEWQTKAREEIMQAFGRGELHFEGLKHLKIVTMILNEVLRLYPPSSMVLRATHKDTKLGNMTIPSGVHIIIPIIHVQHDHEIWGDDAREFKPERFSEGVANATKGRGSASFLPFGAGPKICIGQNFSLTEAKVALAKIMQRFSFELSSSYKHSPLSMLSLPPQVAWERKCIYIWFGQKPRVFIRDLELIKDILSRPGEFQRPQHEPLRDSIIGGLVVSEGEKWTKHRHIINPALAHEQIYNLFVDSLLNHIGVFTCFSFLGSNVSIDVPLAADVKTVVDSDEDENEEELVRARLKRLRRVCSSRIFRHPRIMLKVQIKRKTMFVILYFFSGAANYIILNSNNNNKAGLVSVCCGCKCGVFRELVPLGTRATSYNPFGRSNYSVSNSSKFPLNGLGVLTRESGKRKQNHSNVPNAPESVITSCSKQPVPKLTVSPLRKFQLIDSDSDSDIPSISKVATNKTCSKSESHLDRGKSVGLHQPRKLSESLNTSDRKDLWKYFRLEKSFHIPTPALDEVCNEYFSSMKEKENRGSEQPSTSNIDYMGQFSSGDKTKQADRTNKAETSSSRKNSRVQADGQATGHWFTNGDGKRITTRMASTSSSSIQKSFKYDVFLSFRGGDTRNNFVGHLYEALQRNCIETYMDDKKIEQGKTIKDQLIKSIEDSRFYIIVFSKTYASSSWCLDELVKIMECKKTAEQNVYPVFFDVEPTEVRKQSGAVKEAFAKHEKEKAAGTWIEAMKEASNLAGWEMKVTANGDESKLIQIIVAIFKKLYSTNSNAGGKLVGMDIRISDVLSSLETSAEDVRMIGIKGIGGGGKTTLARVVYDQISNHFEGKSFVENVREVSKPSLSGLKKLQKKILKDVLNKQDITFSSVHDGKNMLKATMRRRKILVVLDDVDHIDQLEALAGEPNWFKSGSRIIITTRDEQVLLAHRVNFVHDVNLLSPTEAICLFSMHAFQTELPIEGYKKLSEQVLRYASGLPLTIKVLGSFLCGKNEHEWEDTIQRLKTIPLKETMQILELSYNGLEEDFKEIFLDVACTIKGWVKEDAIIVLESRGFRARIGLRILEQKSLITYDEDGFLGMHDHLEEMGRNIVRRLHPDEPYKRSRLWIDEEIEDILTNDSGTQATKCLKFESFDFIAEIAMKRLASMNDLKVLHNLRFLTFLSSKLQTFDLRVAPNLERLTIYECYDFVEIHMPARHLKLKYLNLSHSKLTTLHLGDIPNIEKLILEDCNHLVELQMPAESPKLEWVDLSHSKLTNLHLGNSPNLQKLILEGCNDLVELKMPDDSLKLQYFELSHSKLKTLHLGKSLNLEKLILEGCNDLVELKMPDDSLKLQYFELSHSKLKSIHLGSTLNLETLILEGCNDLAELQMPAESLKLLYFELSHSQLKTLHLGSTPNLKKLILDGCNDLVEFQMPAESLKLEELYLSHSKLRTLDLGLTPNLKRLNLENCYDLVEINAPVGYLKKLAFLDISGCGSFKSFVFDKWSQPAVAGSLSELHLIAEPTDVCPLHSNNDSLKFQFLCYYKEDPASSFGNLERLISIGLCACTNLESFSRSICSLQCIRKLTLEGSIAEAPRDLDQLECLEELTFSSTEIKHLPDRICKLKHLKSFKIKSCWLLEKLPEDIGRLESLEKLILTDCKLLQDIPNSICKMKCINKLHLHGCIQVVELPEEIGCLEGLKELNIEDTGIIRLPQSIFKLRGLRIVGSVRLIDTHGLLLKRRRTSDDDEIVWYI